MLKIPQKKKFSVVNIALNYKDVDKLFYDIIIEDVDIFEVHGR